MEVSNLGGEVDKTGNLAWPGCMADEEDGPSEEAGKHHASLYNERAGGYSNGIASPNLMVGSDRD